MPNQFVSLDQVNLEESIFRGQFDYTHEVIFEDSEGKVTRIEVPDSPYWFLDPRVMKEHGYSTVGEFLSFLNKIGDPRDSYFLNFIKDVFYRDVGTRKWTTSFSEDKPLVAVEVLNSNTQSFFHLIDPPEENENEGIYSFYGDLYLVDNSHGLFAIFGRKRESVGELDNNLTRVLDYNFAPFFGQTPFEYKQDRKDVGPYYGVEIEVSTRISPLELQTIVTEVEPKQEPFFYFKHDGSIYPCMDYAYEIVTFPCKKRFLVKNLRTLFDKLQRLSEEKGNSLRHYFDCQLRMENGLHIHVDKTAFRSRLVANRFASIWNQWSRSSLAMLNKFSKRPNGIEAAEYCGVHPGMDRKTLPARLKIGAVVTQTRERRSACREAPATLEVRVFQGLFDLDHILNSIQVVDAMFYFAHEMSLSSFDMKFAPAFKKWIRSKGGYLRVQNMLKGDK